MYTPRSVEVLKSLNQQHKAAARMKVEGKSQDYIHEQLGVTKRTLSKWFSDDLMKSYIGDLEQAVEANFADKLATAGMSALQSLVELVEKPDTDSTISANQKMLVAAEILDRLPETSRVRERQQAPGAGNQTLIFANKSNDEIVDFLQGGWRDLVPSGHSDSSS